MGTPLRQRFAREAQATAELQSPHTVQLFDFGMTETGSFYYVMERLRGMDLQRMVERHGPLPPARAVFLLKQACRSLSEAHALGLVHRDIKPANLFVCRLGTGVRLPEGAGFRRGVAARRASRRRRSPWPAWFWARRRFLRPNWCRARARSTDAPTSTRSAASRSGCSPAGRRSRPTTLASLLMHHSKTTPAPPSMLSEEPIPADVDALVLECLSKEPSARPASADILWERLDGIRSPRSGTSGAHGPGGSCTNRSHRPV